MIRDALNDSSRRSESKERATTTNAYDFAVGTVVGLTGKFAGEDLNDEPFEVVEVPGVFRRRKTGATYVMSGFIDVVLTRSNFKFVEIEGLTARRIVSSSG